MITKDFRYTKLADNNRLTYVINASSAKGIDKLVALYVKALLTIKGSNLDDLDYGTRLLEIVGSNTDIKGQTARIGVIEAVRDATQWVKSMQFNNPDLGEDILVDVKVRGVVYDTETNGVIVDLALKTSKNRIGDVKIII